jgi:hypothetical protein
MAVVGCRLVCASATRSLGTYLWYFSAPSHWDPGERRCATCGLLDEHSALDHWQQQRVEPLAQLSRFWRESGGGFQLRCCCARGGCTPALSSLAGHLESRQRDGPAAASAVALLETAAASALGWPHGGHSAPALRGLVCSAEPRSRSRQPRAPGAASSCLLHHRGSAPCGHGRKRAAMCWVSAREVCTMRCDAAGRRAALCGRCGPVWADHR